MFDEIIPIIRNPFIIKSIIGACLYSISAGIIGSYISFKNISGITGSISHSILGGLAIGALFVKTTSFTFLSPIYTGIIFSVLSALFITKSKKNSLSREDSISTILWVIGVSIAIIVQSGFPQTSQEISKYIFGNIFWISKYNLIQFFIFDIIALTLILTFHNQIKMICLDERIAHAQGIKVHTIHFILLCLITISITLLTMSVGNLMVITFLNIPAMISNNIFKNTEKAIICSCITTFFSSIAGISISIKYNIPPSVSTSVILLTIFLISKLYSLKDT